MYSKKDLIELIDTYRREYSSENEWLEFKENNDNPEMIGEYISALSNGAALKSRPFGYLIYGIDDSSHEVVGTDFDYKNIKRGNEELENWLHRLVEPSIDFEFYEVEYSDFKKVVIIKVQAAKNQPTRFSGISYIRVGSYKKKLKDYPNIEKKLWLSLSEYSYEENISRNQNLHFKQFSIIADSKGIEFSKNKLQTLNFVNEDNKFNNLALLMSDENPYVVKFAVYDENLNFIVKREFEGSWLWILEQVIEFTKTYNTTSAKIEKGNFARVETQSYPDPSTREIVLNCFAHLDLTQPSNIKIEFYKDKCVITSPGALYKNSIEDILKGKQSFRNKNLVKLLDKFDYIENYAKGIERTIKAYDQYSVNPTFDADSEYFFTVTLPNVNYYINLENGTINGTINGIINDTINDLEKKVLQLIFEDQNITIKSLVEKTNKSPRTINRILFDLKEKNILQRVGSRKDGYWKINK